MSSLMQLQKEKSPKSVPTRPAGLRRGAEKENRRREKRQEHCTEKSDTGKGRRRPKPGKAARNAAVKFDAAAKGKVTENRAHETRRSPKRSRRGKEARRKDSQGRDPKWKQQRPGSGNQATRTTTDFCRDSHAAAASFVQKSAFWPVQKQYYRSEGSRVVGVECSH